MYISGSQFSAVLLDSKLERKRERKEKRKMEINDQSLGVLRDLLTSALSPDNTTRKNAENYINTNRKQPGFSLLVLTLVTRLASASTGSELAIRQSASVLFKNLVKEYWQPEDDNGYSIPDGERSSIKSNVIELMTTAPYDVQKQLAEAVSIIAKYDFPEQWQDLLPQLAARLKAIDYFPSNPQHLNHIMVLKGIMLTANSIMKRFRFVSDSDELFTVIKYSVEQFAAPLLEAYQKTSLLIQSLPTNSNDEGLKQELLLLFESQRLMSRIFFSLNWQDLPEYFEDNMTQWMTEFAKYFDYTHPLLINQREESEPGPIDKLQTAIVENLNIYASKYEEEFDPFLGQFTQLIWKLLITVDMKSKYDQLATSGINFLTTVSSKQMNMKLFSDEKVLRDIIEQIIVKNITSTENDEDLFENNPLDYIRKDIEGSDNDTRRRATMDLVRSLMKFFAPQVTNLCLGYINILLEKYQQQKNNWKAKDAALHLVLAVSVKSVNAANGASELNPAVNIVQIFESHVLPEIHDTSVNARTIVKADAIKLICVLRSHFPTPFLVSLLPHIIRHLQSESLVVQTYAAMCIERFLSIKDRDTGVSRVTKADLLPVFQSLFGGLFAVLQNPELPENEYVMKCIMRTLSLLGKDLVSLTEHILNHLIKALEKVYKNPANPYYNHYLFESLALTIRAACGDESNTQANMSDAQLAACNSFEVVLFPIFQNILQHDIAEFVPYVFQIFAQLLAARPQKSGLTEPYRVLFPPLLSPTLWERKGNVPALVDLFQAYVSRGMNEIISGNYITGVLGIFQKLLSSKATESSAYQLLNTIYVFCPTETLTPFINTIFSLQLHRLQEQIKKTKVLPFSRSFILSLCIFVLVHGAKVAYDTLESLTKGLVGMVINSIWEANRENCAAANSRERKLMLLGGLALLKEGQLMSNLDTWKNLLLCLLPLARSGNGLANALEFADLEGGDEAKSFDTTYSKLQNASIYTLDLRPEVTDLATTLVSETVPMLRNFPNRQALFVSQVDGKDAALLRTLHQQVGM